MLCFDHLIALLAPYLEKRMRVKFNGGREASGILKGYDALLNLVLDNATEYLKGEIRHPRIGMLMFI